MARTPIGFLILLFCLVLTACKLRLFNSDQLADRPELLTRSEYFNHDHLWYARVSGWDKSKIQSWQIGTKTTVPGSRLELFKLNSQQAASAWCPEPQSIQAAKKYFSTENFSISVRGDKSKGTPKGSYLIHLNTTGERFLKLERLHFVAMFNDLSQMREALAQSLFKRYEVPTPRNTYIRFCLDDVYRGLYIHIEDVDETFSGEVLKKPRFFSIYEGKDGELPDSGQLSLRSGAGSPRDKYLNRGYAQIAGSQNVQFDDFELLLKSIANQEQGPANRSPARENPELEKIFDVPTFVRWMAVNTFLGGWDNYYLNAKNYFLVNTGNRQEPFFHWVGIDLDNTFGVSFSPHDWATSNILDWERVRGNGQHLPLISAILKNPSSRQMYLATLNSFTEKNPKSTIPVVQSFLFENINNLWQLIESSVVKESDSEKVDFTKTDPFKMAHTARQFTTEDIRRQITEESEKAETPYGWASMSSPHLKVYIKRRIKSISDQMEAINKISKKNEGEQP